MPDWSYRTVFRPLFFRLPAARARDLCLGLMGMLARLPLGPQVIDFLGHMRPSQQLRRSLRGITFPTPVGLGAGIDIHATALPALARFGFGFLEVGPVTAEPVVGDDALAGRAEEAIWYPELPPNPGAAALARRLAECGPLPVPLAVRLACRPGTALAQATAECRRMIEQLAPHAALFTLATTVAAEGAWTPDQWREHLREVVSAVGAAEPPRCLLLCVPADLDPAAVDVLVWPAAAAGAAGVLVDGTLGRKPSRLLGPPARDPARRLVQHLAQSWGHDLVLVASGGVHEPEHALQLFEAGADLVLIDSGLVYAGPGLPKRVNEALLYARHAAGGPPDAAPAAERSWFWTTLLGASMLGGGLLALAIAATRVVLPYDEHFVGMTPEQFAAVNPRLLPFMTHDRVTLAGTMISVGILFLALSLCGIRRGLHWARVAVLSSAFAGFGSFFLFLGFGYFDPFHAFVTAVLFQFVLFALHAPLSPPAAISAPNLREDRSWRLSQWGQLLLIIQGAVLVTAGLEIARVGVTSVFVPEDLEFMHTTPLALATANPRLVPLIAHDRASFGGMLVACGLVVLLTALWGYRQGAGWVWWMLLASGLAGYVPAIVVHLTVGYTNAWHLAPAFAGLLLLGLGLALSYPYLARPDPAHAAAWQRHLDRAAGTSGTRSTG
jgi:dihydroorotate dehydrogenase